MRQLHVLESGDLAALQRGEAVTISLGGGQLFSIVLEKALGRPSVNGHLRPNKVENTIPRFRKGRRRVFTLAQRKDILTQVQTLMRNQHESLRGACKTLGIRESVIRRWGGTTLLASVRKKT